MDKNHRKRNTFIIVACLAWSLIFVGPSYTQSIPISNRSVNQWFAGTWKGRLYEPQNNLSYIGHLSLHGGNTSKLGKIVGTSYYPIARCGGVLKLQGFDSNKLYLREYPRNNSCFSAGDITLTFHTIGSFYADWFDIGRNTQYIFGSRLNRTNSLICGSPLPLTSFSSLNPQYHYYSLITEICDKSTYSGSRSCTESEVFQFMTSALKYQAPPLVSNRNDPVINCNKYDLLYVGSRNPIIVRVDQTRHESTNITLPGHFFHPGKIRREVKEIGNKVFVVTTGDGEGPYGRFNVVFGTAAFKSIDLLMASDF